MPHAVRVSELVEARAIALELPGAIEQDHHGMASFRVGGKIFATVPDLEHVRVMLDEPGILAAVAEYPEVCAPYYWGKKLSCAVVSLPAASSELLRELLTDAWLRRAPRGSR